ncbi:hypothetical protein [Streptomyces sp. G45]|uniref:hypothetical protein n=1 Tax=Streptomyces sp. G45 TaxID=3406627 RepID=UPI003C137EF7
MPEAHRPRCGGPRGDRPARSRLTTDRDVLICTPCGTGAAVRGAHGQAPVSFDEWAVS